MSLIDRLTKGEIPPVIETVAREEGTDPSELAARVVAGTVVVPRNRLSVDVKPVGIGAGMSIKVNANIGTSPDYPDLDDESRKCAAAAAAGADTLMDLSIGGNIDRIRRSIRETWGGPLGTVPVYQGLIGLNRPSGMGQIGRDEFFDAVERQAADGIDFFTIHAGVTREVLDVLVKHRRLTGIVSRGGAFMAAWMLEHDAENPYYEEFDRLLDVLHEFDITLSLGDGLRPGCLDDATDEAQLAELRALGGLVLRARERGVQAVVEGPGHVPLDQVALNVELEKEAAHGAPFYVLGPLVTDIGAGYDHITAAIGGAAAGAAGADWLCCVTPREHLGLPTAADIHEGVMAARIAAHAADIVRKPEAADRDRRMARARKALDWEAQMELALDSEQARRSFRERQGTSDACTMCSGFCAMRLIGEYLPDGETADCVHRAEALD